MRAELYYVKERGDAYQDAPRQAGGGCRGSLVCRDPAIPLMDLPPLTISCLLPRRVPSGSAAGVHDWVLTNAMASLMHDRVNMLLVVILSVPRDLSPVSD